MSETMRVFKDRDVNGKNFKIVGITEEDIMWRDFIRAGNPAKNVPPNGFATFCVKFDSPNAGDYVVSQLEELYNVNTNIVVPNEDQDFAPYKTMKLAARFDMFPPTIILHVPGADDVTLTHFIRKLNKTDRVDPRVVDEFNENVAVLQWIWIDHIDVDVNVSDGGKPYITRMDVYQAADEFGNPARHDPNGREYDELAEREYPVED